MDTETPVTLWATDDVTIYARHDDVVMFWGGNGDYPASAQLILSHDEAKALGEFLRREFAHVIFPDPMDERDDVWVEDVSFSLGVVGEVHGDIVTLGRYWTTEVSDITFTLPTAVLHALIHALTEASALWLDRQVNGYPHLRADA